MKIQKKVCICCGQLKDIDNFHRNKNKQDGRKSYCKVCRSEMRRLSKLIKLRKRITIPGQKFCSYCKQSKNPDKFCKNRSQKDGRNNYCKTCCRERDQLPHIREQHKKALLKFKSRPDILEIWRKYDKKYSQSEGGKATIKAYKEKHKGKLKFYHKGYSKQWAKTLIGKASLKKARQKHYYKNLEYSRKLQRESYYRRKQKVEYRINDAVSSVIYDALKKNKKGWSWEKLVGYTLSDLMKHLGKLFQPGMSWSNYGKWQIDHILPRSKFSFDSPDDPQFKQCWSLENLQPLWAVDNMKKSNS